MTTLQNQFANTGYWEVTFVSIYFIANPAANAGQAAAVIADCVAFVQQTKLDYHLVKTTRRGDASRIASEVAESCEKDMKLIVIGGDGTLSEVLIGIGKTTTTKLPVGIIPAGKNNRFAKTFNLPCDPLQALQRILAATTPIALPVSNYTAGRHHENSYFLNDFSIGLFAQMNDLHQLVAAEPPTTLKQRLLPKWLKRFFTTVNANMSQEQFALTIRAKGHTKHFKHVYQIHIHAHKNATPLLRVALPAQSEEQFSVVIVRRINIVARLLLKVAQLLGFAAKLPYVHTLTCEHLQLSIDSLEFGLQDGTSLGNHFFDLNIRKTNYPFWM